MPTKYEVENGDCCQAFAASYDLSNLPAMLEIERSVLGCDYGGTSWTTRTQATQIVAALDLQPGVHVLDIGSGSGWPGLYLADASGCEVTLLDLPLNALAIARKRAQSEGMQDRVSTIAASGSALPLGNASFATITHSDVLCCMPEKIDMIEECRRVASANARMLFSVIAVAPNLPEDQRLRALETGPPFVDAPGEYADLLPQSGWRVLEQVDCTPEYRCSLSALVEALDDSAALAAELGEAAVTEACAHRQRQIAAIDAGLLVRENFLALAA